MKSLVHLLSLGPGQHAAPARGRGPCRVQRRHTAPMEKLFLHNRPGSASTRSHLAFQNSSWPPAAKNTPAGRLFHTFLVYCFPCAGSSCGPDFFTVPAPFFVAFVSQSMAKNHSVQNQVFRSRPGRFFCTAKRGVPDGGTPRFYGVLGPVQPSLSRAMICSTICRSAPAPLNWRCNSSLSAPVPGRGGPVHTRWPRPLRRPARC